MVVRQGVTGSAGGGPEEFDMGERLRHNMAELAPAVDPSILLVGVRSAVCLSPNLGGYPSGQRGLTVNQLAQAFGGSNPPPPTERDHNAVIPLFLVRRRSPQAPPGGAAGAAGWSGTILGSVGGPARGAHAAVV